MTVKVYHNVLKPIISGGLHYRVEKILSGIQCNAIPQQGFEEIWCLGNEWIGARKR